MSEQDKGANMTREDLADQTKHPQYKVFESDSRPPTDESTASDKPRQPGKPGESGKAGEGIVGHTAAKDPSGVVAPPAEQGMPGASTILGGTPGALTTSGGRQVDDDGL